MSWETIVDKIYVITTSDKPERLTEFLRSIPFSHMLLKVHKMQRKEKFIQNYQILKKMKIVKKLKKIKTAKKIKIVKKLKKLMIFIQLNIY